MEFTVRLFQGNCRARWAGCVVEQFEAIGSTNSYLKEKLTHEPLQRGHLALTDFQSAGRGRLGRTWVAPLQSSLLVSIVLRPKIPLSHIQWITMIAGLAAHSAISHLTDLEVGLKWPNDVMLRHDGIWHKTGGILAEANLVDDAIESVVLGMGLNVNIEAVDLPEAVTPASSLLVAGGSMVSRELLLARWLEALENGVDSTENQLSPHDAWNELLITRNQPVTVSGAQTVNGIAIGTDEYGRLLVRDDLGEIHPVSAGDVTLRRAPS